VHAVVTETDQAVEAFIKDKIASTYPSFKFIGEESFAGGERVSLTDEPTFIIDPVDGTSNFVRPSYRPSLPLSSLSLTYLSSPAGSRPRLCASSPSPPPVPRRADPRGRPQVCCSIGFTYKQVPVIG